MLKKTMVILAMVGGVVLTLAPPAHAELYLYEPFDYTAGGLVSDEAGPLGAGVDSWTGGGFIKDPTKVYSDEASENLSANGGYMEVGGPNGGGSPTMNIDMNVWPDIYKTEVGGEGTGDFQLGKPGATFWMSFWRQASSFPPDPNYWFEDIAISGVLIGRYYWQQRLRVIYGEPWGQTTSVFADEEAFCLVRHKTDATGETKIDLWINPPLTDEGALDTTFDQSRRSTGTYTDQRFKAVTYRFAGGSERWADYDEFRMGELFSDVAPFELVAPASSLKWQGGAGQWDAGNWTDDITPDMAPVADNEMIIDDIGGTSVVTVASDFTGGVDGPAFSVVIGENNAAELVINTSVTLDVSRPVTVGTAGQLSVNGTLNALYMDSSGDVDFNTGSVGNFTGDVRVLAGTADFAAGSTINTPTLQNAGTVNANGVLNALIHNTGTFNAGAGSTIAATNLTNFDVFNSGGALTATILNNAGAFTVTGGSVVVTDLVNSGAFVSGGNPVTATNLLNSGTFTGGASPINVAGVMNNSGTFTTNGVLNIAELTSSGTTDLTGSSGAIALLNVVGGTTTLASPDISQLNALGGVLNINGSSHSIANLKVGGGEVNTDAAVSVGGLGVSGGQLNLGGVMSVETAALIRGAVDASANPLSISGELKLSGGITATYTPGGGATSFDVTGANIADNGAIRTITLSGGELAISAIAYDSGLEVRGWDTGGATDPLDGERFDLVAPNPAVTDSTAAGTIGYATESINMDGGDREHFSDGNNSGVPDSEVRPTTGYWSNYNVEYRGVLQIETSGDYQFSTISDDGSAFWIDPASDNPAYAEANVQNGGSHGMQQADSGPITLSAGYHEIILRHCEGGGGNGVQLLWDPTGGTNMVPIPGLNFFHGAGGIVAANLPTTIISATADSSVALTSEPGQPVTLGGIEVADAAVLTINSEATDIQVTNTTMGDGSMVKSSLADEGLFDATITVGGEFNSGAGVSFVGDELNDVGSTNLTMADGSALNWTFGSGDSFIDVYGEVTLAGALTIQLVEGGGASGGADVALFRAFDASLDPSLITVLSPPGKSWTWDTDVNDDPSFFFDGEYLFLEGLLTGGGGVPGDVNGDQVVDEDDLALFEAQFGGTPAGADFDGDGDVDLADFAVMRDNWGSGTGGAPGGGLNVTPEPATMCLLAIGGLAVLRKRRKL